MTYIIAILAFISLVGIDQFTKYLCIENLKSVKEIPLIDGVFSLYFETNEGAGFGIFPGGRWFFVSMVALVSVFLIFYFIKIPKGGVYNWVRVSLVLILSGAAGNCADRLNLFVNEGGSVVDFLYFKLIDFPIFNAADIFVVCGAILLCVLTLFFIKEDDKAESNNKNVPSAEHREQ